ncbi:FHA domain-containing protein PS1-like [Phragmites australis]|uniref:FHA domain-containing protein PS1-like n=1 Tax=Phragmites australis TaxID=29695 RepID=UPI002D798579|nr:FHA domain-containing protein PS1-like [Phragmites australis]
MPHMAAAVEEGDGDAPIAAFAVAKGGVVLKHIFLNAPPPEMMRGEGAKGEEEEEEDPPVMVGRHPDCHVLVDHPSVSRFHLRLRARRRQRRITVTDLSSVHGTWVSGRLIPPHTPVDLTAGDTLRLGASKREYRLLWLSLREAFEMGDPLHMPSLPEEDKEESRAYQEVSSQLVPGPRDPEGMETHQETSQQIVSEEIAFPAKVVPSAPPLPEFAHSFSLEESSLSQFHENGEGVTEELVDKNPNSESFGSLIIQEMPAAVTNAGRPVQSDKWDASNQVSKRAKLKSVKSLRVDTGRSKDRSSALSYSFQKGDQNEILLSSQNCGTECAACIALFGITEFEGAEEKEEMIAKDKGHMNPAASISMEGNKKEPNPDNYIPQDSVDAMSQKRLGLLDSVPYLHFKDDAVADKEIPQWNASTVDMESSKPVPENPSMPKVKHHGLNTLNLEGSLSNNENMAPDKIAEGPDDCQLEGTICGNLFGNLVTEGFEENEEISPLDKENIIPNVSGSIIMERSHRGLKPTISQELMDSISLLHLEHDLFSENENSMLNIRHAMKSNEPISENLNPLISAGTKLQKSQTEFMPISHLEFKDDILPDRKNSVLAPGKYDANSPVRQEDLFSDKENVTPTSRDLKPVVRRVLGSRMDNSVSAENTSNKGNHKWECNELSAKSKDFHTVDDDVFYSDKENLTPISSGGMKARKCLPMNLTANADQDREAFCSNKENFTPLSSAARKTRDMSENRARIESAITKKRVVDRLPFETLVSNSPLRPTSSLNCNCAVARAATFAVGDFGIRLEDELNNLPRNNQESGRAGQGMKAWTMVADTDCLLDDESRKSIMLLKGIKGTHLIIPRIVIRELDSIKQREGLFRRSSKATFILQWIEECMENESWWIHVQSSSDMFPVAPTPPSTPSSRCIGEEIEIGSGSFNPMAFFSARSFADISSPKPEDRVLDCALLLNKLRSNHNIVILSNSITLKIKAMAEGLLCEGAKEFREGLMNPCSSRFMWAASVPRGWAWSCLDEAALAENYYNSHHHASKRVPRPVEAAKGLKLILRHNSLYEQATNAVKKTPLASV